MAQSDPERETSPSGLLPPKDSRWDEEADEMALALFSPEDLKRSPEEYAARRGHLWGCFSLHRFRYHDPVLGAWVRRLGDILFSHDNELERCRQKYLTPEELAEVRKQQAEDF